MASDHSAVTAAEVDDQVKLHLRFLEELAFRCVEASPDANIAIDEQGRIQLFNAQAEAMFGYERSEVIGQPVEMLMPMTHRERHESARGEFFSRPGTREMGIGLVLKGIDRLGREFDIRVKLSHTVIAGHGRFGLAIVRRADH